MIRLLSTTPVSQYVCIVVLLRLKVTAIPGHDNREKVAVRETCVDEHHAHEQAKRNRNPQKQTQRKPHPSGARGRVTSSDTRFAERIQHTRQHKFLGGESCLLAPQRTRTHTHTHSKSNVHVHP